jgi:hypothetical protein
MPQAHHRFPLIQSIGEPILMEEFPEEVDPTCQCEMNTYFAGLDERVDCDELEIIYFHHPDYLGSTEFITDMRGEPYQFFLNTPWGDQALRKSLVGFFSAGASLPRGPENQYAKSYTSFSSRFRFQNKNVSLLRNSYL